MLRFDVKAGPTGSLFGSVTTTDIADEIWRTRKIRVDRRKIGIDSDQADRPLHGPDRRLRGRHGRGQALVVPEGGELPPEEELAAMEAAEEAEAEAAAEADEEAGGRPRLRRRGAGRGGGSCAEPAEPADGDETIVDAGAEPEPENV